LIIRWSRRWLPRALTAMTTPVTTAKAISTTVAAPGLRPDRKSEIAISGPNSPTAPIAITAVPNVVRSSPASRSTGMIVPSAVLVSATPTNTPAAKPSASRVPTPTATASASSQPIMDRLSGLPRRRVKSISDPARKKSRASPNWARAEVKSSGTTQPSRAGPSTMPRTISNTTIGILTNRPRPLASSGAATAMAGIRTSAAGNSVIPGIVARRAVTCR
jgi:hypothetical protein